MNTKTTRVLLYTMIIIAFVYVGITLLAWVILGIFHPNVSHMSRTSFGYHELIDSNSLALLDLVQKPFILSHMVTSLLISVIIFFLKMHKTQSLKHHE